MAAAFQQTLRALAADRPRASVAALLLSAATVGLWWGWFLRARISLHAVTADARIEVEERAHAVDAAAAGRVSQMNLELGREVKAGEVLVELDSGVERRQMDLLRAHLEALVPEVEAAQRELAAQRQALGDADRATLAALDEGRVRAAGAQLAADQARQESQGATKLLERGLASPVEASRLGSEAAQKQAEADAASLSLERVQRDQRTRGSEGLARTEALRRDLATLEGEQSTTRADIRVLEETLDRSRVRAPVAGRIADIAPVNVGSYVRPGDRLFSVVPHGELKAVANFLPADALGRVRVGQSARLRLEGFPWMQFGTVAATVARVGSELRDGKVRVELEIHPDPTSGIPMQHGLPGQAEVDVEQVSPARLVLRSIGGALGQPPLLAPSSP